MKSEHRTREFVKLWGTKDTPTARVEHGNIPTGIYQAFALYGWVSKRPEKWPVVGLRLSVLDENNTRTIGGINMGLPLTPRTEHHVCCFLEDLGWDGRVWPYRDHGWPSGTEEEQPLASLLRTVRLGATLTFPPVEQGTLTVRVPVLNSKKDYTVAPFADRPLAPRFTAELRALANNPAPFKSDWKS